MHENLKSIYQCGMIAHNVKHPTYSSLYDRAVMSYTINIVLCHAGKRYINAHRLR